MNKDAPPADIFRTEGLSKYYPQTQSFALRDVNLAIAKGEFLGIKGPSGSGKSTLLYLLAGLHTPTGGEIYFQERPLQEVRDKAIFRRKNIGFVFQDFYLYPRFTALENVLFPCLHSLVIPAAVTQKAVQLLEYLNIRSKRDVPVEVLSAGERQRVCMARALLNDPQCVLADEPTGNLDTENATNILGLLQKINRERGTTVVLVTHDDKVAHYAHRLVHIIDGRLQ